MKFSPSSCYVLPPSLVYTLFTIPCFPTPSPTFFAGDRRRFTSVNSGETAFQYRFALHHVFSLARCILILGRSICTIVTADVIICTEADWSQPYQLQKTMRYRPDNLGSTPPKNTWIFFSISRPSLTQSISKLQGFHCMMLHKPSVSAYLV